MPRATVVLDANAFHNNWFARGPNFGVLGEATRRGLVRVLLPQVALEETLNNFRRRAQELRKKSSAFEDLYRGSVKPPLDDAHMAALCEAQEKELLGELRDLGIEVVPYGTLPHAPIVKRAIGARKPFSEGGAGYRDTLIWETTLRESRGSRATYLVTSNHKDFGAGGVSENDPVYALHPDLIADLEEQGRAANSVMPHRTVADLVHLVLARKLARRRGRRSAAAVRTFRRSAKLGTFSLAALFEDPSDDVMRALNAADKRYVLGAHSVGAVPPEFEDPHVTGVWPPERIEVGEVVVLGEGTSDTLFARFEADVRLEIDVTVFKGDYDAVTSSIPLSVSDWDWNEHYALASVSVMAHIEGAVEIDIESEGLEGIEFESLGETWGWCRHCKAQVMSDAAEECGACGKSFGSSAGS